MNLGDLDREGLRTKLRGLAESIVPVPSCTVLWH
jgi:hypothetical protein